MPSFRNLRIDLYRLFLTVLLLTPGINESREELAKKSQNPVGNIISLPIDYWHYDNIHDYGFLDAVMAF